MGQAIKFFTILVMAICMGFTVQAAPYAAMVVDARNGKVIHSRNADARLHPASLTKMMTLYVVFDAIERGEIGLDTMVKVSKHAASEPPSKLGLKRGQRISMRNLIRAAAVKSANDAATALGEALSGSEARFARRMTDTAHKIGMKRSTFKNAHGLTAKGHLSTARDMTLLGRRLFYDFPEYYNLFSRVNTNVGARKVYNTNRRLLGAYKGADGIKTGYTRAAGFNLVASAERGNERVIATVFGGRTPVVRNQKIAELLDLGFRKAPTRVAVRKPARVNLARTKIVKTKVAKLPLKRSLRPFARPLSASQESMIVASIDIKEIEDAIAVATKVEESRKQENPTTGMQASLRPIARPSLIAVAKPAPKQVAQKKIKPEPKIIQRASKSDTGNWAVYLGAFPNSFAAEKHLLKTALSEMESLENATRKVDYKTIDGAKKYRARFTGLSQKSAMKACARIQARSQTCMMIAPGA